MATVNHGHDRRAAQQEVTAAARGLRDRAIAGQYAGLDTPHRAFQLALLVDELARHLGALPDAVRDTVLAQCRVLASPDDAPRPPGGDSSHQ